MINLFDSENYPDEEPKTLLIGSRWAWTRSDITAAYPTASYTLKYLFMLQSSDDYNITLTASKVSNAHVLESAITATSKHVAGQYAWHAIVVRDSDSEEIVVDQGLVEFKAQTGDTRSHAYKTLQAIRATIEGKATKDQLSVSVNGYSLSRYSFEDLVKMEREYSIRWEDEKKKSERNQGRNGRNRVLVKMGA